MILNWKENMSNYDKLYKVLSAWYTPDQINEIWAMLKDYDRKIHKKYLERQAASSKLQAWHRAWDLVGWYYERYKKETSKTSKEILAIAGTGDQRHANERL